MAAGTAVPVRSELAVRVRGRSAAGTLRRGLSRAPQHIFYFCLCSVSCVYTRAVLLPFCVRSSAL